MKYDVVIGLEIHAELSTDSKIFCKCGQQFGAEPNTLCCPICLAMPGTLPSLNNKVIEYAIMAGLCLNCKINHHSAFDRKNYFYPDLSKAYQTSQFYYPICSDGYIDIGDKVIRINRIHLEEDAGKLIHDDYMGVTIVDYNRGGVPLIEIVTEPDINSSQEAATFAEIIAENLRYAGVCDARMEQGSLRCDVNISLKPKGSTTLGTRAEIKNLNSFRNISRAIEYEIKRQTDTLDQGQEVIQETRRFNDSNGRTFSMRIKEEADDYRYFPDSDIPAIAIDDNQVQQISKRLPMLPAERLELYTKKHKIPLADAKLLLTQKVYSDFFNETVKTYDNPKAIASLFVTEVFRLINDFGFDGNFKFSPTNLGKVVEMLDKGDITKSAQKIILKVMYQTGEEPQHIAKKHGLMLINDIGAVDEAIKEVINANPKAVEQYRNGEEKVFGFLMGQTARKVGKSASPSLIREQLLKALKA